MNWYMQIYELIKEAVFGAEAVLTNNQLFLLDQISTYLSVGLAVLPALLCVGWLVKVTFR